MRNKCICDFSIFVVVSFVVVLVLMPGMIVQHFCRRATYSRVVSALVPPVPPAAA